MPLIERIIQAPKAEDILGKKSIRNLLRHVPEVNDAMYDKLNKFKLILVGNISGLSILILYN